MFAASSISVLVGETISLVQALNDLDTELATHLPHHGIDGNIGIHQGVVIPCET